MGYSRQDILIMCKAAIKDVSTFYTKEFINYSGRTVDTNEHYTEIISEFLILHISELKNKIKKISRISSYKTPGHNGECTYSSNRIEENIAKTLFSFCKDGGKFNHIGKIIDYQTPLKSTSKDIAGKIDLLAYDGICLRILELKKPDSEETMLRCVIEGFTYLQTVDKEKLIKDFSLPEDTVIKACPFVFKDGNQQKEMEKNRPYLFKLMKLLDSTPFYIVKKNNHYNVEV